MSKIESVKGTITYEDGEKVAFAVAQSYAGGWFWRLDGNPHREIAARGVDFLDAVQEAAQEA